jgi:hypothetical protein
MPKQKQRNGLIPYAGIRRKKSRLHEDRLKYTICDSDDDPDESDSQSGEGDVSDVIEEIDEDESVGDDGDGGGNGDDDDNNSDSAGDNNNDVEMAVQTAECCYNCKRRRRNVANLPRDVELCLVSADEVKRFRKTRFSQLRGFLSGQCHLCRECRFFFCSESQQFDRVDLEWPGFIWYILSTPFEGNGDYVWSLIPKAWRGWWIESAVKQEHLQGITMDSPESLIVDVTKEVQEVLKVKDELIWKDLKEAWNRLAFLPFVRCPWGCSEFYHLTNDLPYDVLVAWALEEKIRKYSPASSSKWVTGIRNDFLSSKARLLGNLNWSCSPSVMFVKGKGPRLLCCSEHKSTSVLEYIHAPCNPTGVISITGSNQLAPIVPIPRVIKPIRAYQYCTSYEVNKVVGNYNGLDSMYISDQGNFDKQPIEIVAERNALCLAGRSDMRDHIEFLAKEGRIPQWMRKELIDDANERFPDGAESQKHSYCTGATYISADDAFQLELVMKCQGTRTVIIHKEDEEEETVNYIPKWPSMIIRVHPAYSLYGARPAILNSMSCAKIDGRLAWFLCGMIATLPGDFFTHFRI